MLAVIIVMAALEIDRSLQTSITQFDIKSLRRLCFFNAFQMLRYGNREELNQNEDG